MTKWLRDRSTLSLVLLLALGLSLSGCGGRGPETEYGSSAGKSLNGTSVFAAMFADEGHEIRAAIRLTEELGDWASGIVRFAPYPGPPDRDEAAWYRDWLAAESGRWLIYVVGDFVATEEYWREVQAALPPTANPDLKADVEQGLKKAADWVGRLRPKASEPADAKAWFKVESGWNPPQVVTKLDRPWADGVDAVAAALTVHEWLAETPGKVLLEANGKPLVVEKRFGSARMLVIANGSFLLNEPLAKPARRPLAERVVEWAGEDVRAVAMVEGSFVLSDSDGSRSLIQMIREMPDLRWAFFHISAAAVLAALARAPRLGRPRPDPPSGADRPAAHARALGALLERTGSAGEAIDLLDRYRRWRHPRGVLNPRPAFSMPGSHDETSSRPAGPPSTSDDPIRTIPNG